MKKAFIFIFSMIICANLSFAAPTTKNSGANTQNMTYQQAINSNKPAIILVCAPWSENADKNMAALKKAYGSKVNFLTIDISKPEAKELSDSMAIQPKLPNVLLVKNRGNINRFIPKDCTLDYSCISKKVASFL